MKICNSVVLYGELRFQMISFHFTILNTIAWKIFIKIFGIFLSKGLKKKWILKVRRWFLIEKSKKGENEKGFDIDN